MFIFLSRLQVLLNPSSDPELSSQGVVSCHQKSHFNIQNIEQLFPSPYNFPISLTIVFFIKEFCLAIFVLFSEDCRDLPVLIPGLKSLCFYA